MNVQINIHKNSGTYAEATPVEGGAGKGSAEKTLPEENSSNVPVKKEHCENEVKPAVYYGKCRKQILPPVDSGVKNPVAENGPEGAKFSFEKEMVDMFSAFMNSFREMMKEYLSQIKDIVRSVFDSIKDLMPQPKPQPQPKPIDSGSQVENPVSTNPVKKPSTPAMPRIMESFAQRVPGILGNHNGIGHVNEADLQAGIVAYQLYQKSEDAEQYFLQKLGELETGGMNKGEAIKAALIATQESSRISRNEAEFVYTLSHRTSQLDENHDEVSLAPHGAGTMDLGNALKMAEINLAKVIHGQIILEPRQLYQG
jgi:hypothetical protein